MGGWDEIADGVFRHRYNPLDIGICVVRGQHGLLLVDTRSSHREGRRASRADLTELGRPVRWVVNTHAHFDHTWGNAVFVTGSDLEPAIIGHERVPAHLASTLDVTNDRCSRGGSPTTRRGGGPNGARSSSPRRPLWWVTGPPSTSASGPSSCGTLVADTRTTTSCCTCRTSTSGSPVTCSRSPDRRATAPASFPLDWPDTIATLLALVPRDAVVVPGHGAVIDHEYAAAQQVQLQTVAETIRDLYAAGVPVEAAVAAGGARWPFPADGLAGAVRDGYRQLAG